MAALGAKAGATVVDVESGHVLASSGADLALNPASNAKLVTAYAALRVLGPSHRFATGLFGEAVAGEVAELTLRGHGDPSLTTADLVELARALARRGVNRVGTIIVDQSHFDDHSLPPAYDQQPEETAAFRSPVAAVSVNANALSVHVAPGRPGEAAIVTVEPPGLARIEGRVATGRATQPERLTVRVAAASGAAAGSLPLVVTVSGRVPEGAPPASIVRRIDDPSLAAGFVLRWALSSAGITSRSVALGAGSKRELALHRSAPLSELLRALGKDSQNFSAEMILKATGAKARGGTGTSEAGALASRDALAAAGATDPRLVVRNGSGLFDANRLTPSSLATLLRTAARDASIAPEFLSHLAIGGVDGTLRGRFKRWASDRAIRAKTGTLASVCALSGYAFGPEGEGAVAYSFIATEVPGKVRDARRAIDAAVEALAASMHTTTGKSD